MSFVFLNCQVVQWVDIFANPVFKNPCIVISWEKGYRLLSYVCLKRKNYTPYGKIFFQILWGINVKATHNCSSGPVKKKEKRKKRKYNGLTRRQKSLSPHDFPFTSSLKHRNTDPRQLLLLRRPTFKQFFQFRFVSGIFFLNHLAPPSKGVWCRRLLGMWRFLFFGLEFILLL